MDRIDACTGRAQIGGPIPNVNVMGKSLMHTYSLPKFAVFDQQT